MEKLDRWQIGIWKYITQEGNRCDDGTDSNCYSSIWAGQAPYYFAYKS